MNVICDPTHPILMYAAFAVGPDKSGSPEHKGPQSQVPVPTTPILEVLPAPQCRYVF